jgi:hypothetical protein
MASGSTRVCCIPTSASKLCPAPPLGSILRKIWERQPRMNADQREWVGMSHPEGGVVPSIGAFQINPEWHEFKSLHRSGRASPSASESLDFTRRRHPARRAVPRRSLRLASFYQIPIHLRSSAFIPTGFRNKARGCAVFGATPGNIFSHAPNPVGVGVSLSLFPG